MPVVPGQQARGGALLRISSWRHNRSMAETRKDKQPPEAPLPRRGRTTPLGTEAGLAGQTAFVRAGFADPTLVLRWEEIAGAETAALAQPIKLSEGPSGGVLTLKAEPGAALFLQHESRALCERINTYLGRPAVAGCGSCRAPFSGARNLPRNGQPPDPSRRPTRPGNIKARKGFARLS